MKNLRYWMILMMTLLLVACEDRYESEIFEQSPAERTDATVERYRFALLASETWVLEYFPDDNLNYGGWVYVIQFRNDNTLTAWFEGSTFVTKENPVVESEYAVEFSTGPMLKFNTHNDYLHYFTVAGDNGSGYQGYKGDFEFTLMSLSPAFDEIIMRGNRTENRYRMTPLSGEYTPESYIEAVRGDQTANGHTSFRLMANGEQIGTMSRPNKPYFTNFHQYASSKVWTISYAYEAQMKDPDTGLPIFDEQGAPVMEMVQVQDRVSAINLPGNIMKFYEPYTFKGEVVPLLKGQTMQTFEWQLGPTSAGDHFACTDSFFDFQLLP